MTLKQQLYALCTEIVHKRLHTIETTIASHQKALQSETKSSAGDKHETGRAMLQLEMEKAGQQLSVVSKMKTVLSQIDISKTTNTVHLGSVVKTTTNNYFLCVIAGKLTVNNEVYFAISSHAPIGKLLLGKQQDDIIVWNGISQKIISVL